MYLPVAGVTPAVSGSFDVILIGFHLCEPQGGAYGDSCFDLRAFNVGTAVSLCEVKLSVHWLSSVNIVWLSASRCLMRLPPWPIVPTSQCSCDRALTNN